MVIHPLLGIYFMIYASIIMSRIDGGMTMDDQKPYAMFYHIWHMFE